ncbi:hypothetical protein Tco_1161444 [Tanacetum coccineum]
MFCTARWWLLLPRDTILLVIINIGALLTLKSVSKRFVLPVVCLYCQREISTASIRRTVVTRVNIASLIFEVSLDLSKDTKPYIKLRSSRSVHWDQQGDDYISTSGEALIKGFMMKSEEVDINKKTENQAKMTKLSMEWKRLCKIKAKVQKCQSQSQYRRISSQTGAGTEEYY